MADNVVRTVQMPNDLKLPAIHTNEEVEDNQIWLTSVDNPFDPFTDFDNWYRFDTDKGYYTAGLIARFTDASAYELSDADYNSEVEQAVERALATDLEGYLFKVVRVGGKTIPPIHPNPKESNNEDESEKQ